MEIEPPISKFSQPSHSRFSAREGRSGYEPSDTETEWHETSRHERERKNLTLGPEETKALTLMNKSSMSLHRRHALRFDHEISSPASRGSVPNPARRRHLSKSPYKPFRADGDGLSPITGLDMRRNVSPLPKPDLGRQVSPYKSERENHNQAMDGTLSNYRKLGQRTPPGENRVSEKPNYRRPVTAPRLRGREKEQESNYEQTLSKGTIHIRREASNGRAPSIGEINEMVAQAKISDDPRDNNELMESTESTLPGDIFFSRECTATLTQKTSLTKSNIDVVTEFGPRPKILPQRSTPFHHPNRGKGNLNMNIRGTSSSTVLSRSTTVSSSAAKSKKGSGKLSASSSMTSDASGKTSASVQKFIANRKKSQAPAWFACMRKESCKTSKESPEHRSIDEASFIEKAFVVERLPQFWADKYQPASLDGFICHQQEAQLLKKLVSQDVCPHILLKGPSGSGKRALAMALLREIYGDACSNLSHDLKQFSTREKRPTKVTVPITSSSHHMELNVNMEPSAKYALMGLVKEISSEFSIIPEDSNINFKSNYKVIVLYEVDQAADNIQHMIKWIIDRYSDICKLVVCCEDDADILEPVKNRFKVIQVDAPPTHEIMDVLVQIAKQEEIDLSMNFAAKIATKSKQNLREAIMALEACRAHNYPFSEEQPVLLGWEEILMEISAEILSDPSHSRLFSIRGKFQKLLVDFVDPQLILRKLVEQLLKGIDCSLKREVFYWHAYYDKRLPPGTTALLKLEEFVAKFMSIYRKSCGSRQFV